jgi:hypothetical protein
MPEYEKGTHLLASRTGHLEWPSKERFQCAPMQGRISTMSFELRNFPDFSTDSSRSYAKWFILYIILNNAAR